MKRLREETNCKLKQMQCNYSTQLLTILVIFAQIVKIHRIFAFLRGKKPPFYLVCSLLAEQKETHQLVSAQNL